MGPEGSQQRGHSCFERGRPSPRQPQHGSCRRLQVDHPSSDALCTAGEGGIQPPQVLFHSETDNPKPWRGEKPRNQVARKSAGALVLFERLQVDNVNPLVMRKLQEGGDRGVCCAVRWEEAARQPFSVYGEHGAVGEPSEGGGVGGEEGEGERRGV